MPSSHRTLWPDLRTAAEQMWKRSQGSPSRCLPAVDMQDVASDELGSFEVENCIDDVGYLADATERMKTLQLLIGGRVVPRRLDDAERYRVDPDAARGVFDRQRTADGDESSFGQRR